jgi:ATP-binding cassette subfamily F protein uup
VEAGDKIGIVGVNGTGKSTFLKILSGQAEPDDGMVSLNKSQRLLYLPQMPEIQADLGIMAYIFQWRQDLLQALERYESLLAQPLQDERWQKELQRQNEELVLNGAWEWEHKAKAILTKLGLKDFSRLMGELSGGEQKRVALAATLLEGEGTLLLDEPTNHLDHAGTEWLEKVLKESKNTLVMITHDRYFLDRVATKIWELDQGKLYTYVGNYTDYLAGQAERLAMAQSTEDKRQNLLRNELKWIRRGAQARSTKQKARIQRFEALKEEEPGELTGSIEIKAASQRLGKKSLVFAGVSHSLGGAVLFKPFSYACVAGERIGILGANGAGKTTFLRLINGDLQPEAGEIEIGSTVKIGFFSQLAAELDGSMRVIDHVRSVAEYIKLEDGQQLTALKLCETFLFKGAAAFTPVEKLSGGEKRRLQLLKVLMSAPNVLLLDEPTNDLDTLTLTILEAYLQTFEGVIIAVSHDRYFLDKVATTIFSLDQNEFQVYKGNYSDYEAFMENEADTLEATVLAKTVQPKKEAANPTRTKTKLSYKEQMEYDNLESDLTKLEAELGQVNIDLAAAFSDYQKLQALTDQQQLITRLIDEKLARWAELEDMLEQFKESP